MLKSATSFYDENQSNDDNNRYYEELDFIRKKSTFIESNSNFMQNFDFRSKLTRDAVKDLGAERSKSFIGSQKSGPVLDYWKIKPPDFRYSQFDPKPMSGKEKARIKQEQVKEMKAKVKPKSAAPVLTLHAKEFLHQQPQFINEKSHAEFKRKFHILQPQEDRVLNLPSRSPYKDPKEHDFRQYLPPAALGLPEFIAVKSPDPGQMSFKRDILKHRIQRSAYKVRKTVFREVDPGLQLGDKVKTPVPSFQPELNLPKEDYPAKHEEFTRHRRFNRSVRSAFMEKVEEQLSKKWQQDFKERVEYLEKLKNLELQRRLMEEQNRRNNHSRSATSTYSVN